MTSFRNRGEFEILLSGSRSAPVEIGSNPVDWGLSGEQVERIDAVAAVSRAVVVLDDGSNDPVPYVLRGADEAFAEHGGLPLYLWDESLGSTESEVWERVLSDDTWVIVDASFGLEATTDGAAVGVLPLKLGQDFDLMLLDPGTAKSVRVAGFLAQSLLPFLRACGRTKPWLRNATTAPSLASMFRSSPRPPSLMTIPRTLRCPLAKTRTNDGPLRALPRPWTGSDGVLVTLIVDDILLVQGLVLAILAISKPTLPLGSALACWGLVWSPRVRFATGPTS